MSTKRVEAWDSLITTHQDVCGRENGLLHQKSASKFSKDKFSQSQLVIINHIYSNLIQFWTLPSKKKERLIWTSCSFFFGDYNSIDGAVPDYFYHQKSVVIISISLNKQNRKEIECGRDTTIVDKSKRLRRRTVTLFISDMAQIFDLRRYEPGCCQNRSKIEKFNAFYSLTLNDIQRMGETYRLGVQTVPSRPPFWNSSDVCRVMTNIADNCRTKRPDHTVNARTTYVFAHNTRSSVRPVLCHSRTKRPDNMAMSIRRRDARRCCFMVFYAYFKVNIDEYCSSVSLLYIFYSGFVRFALSRWKI